MQPAKLLNRNFLLLWQGQLVSQLGDQAFYLAMVLWLMEATGSASLMGLLMMASLLPSVILGPLGGAIADRFPRVRLIVLCDLLRGVTVLAFAAAMFLRPEETVLLTTLLFAVAVLGGAADAIFQPAVSAAIPDMLPPAKVAAGNSLNQFTVQASVLVGQAAGGILYRLVGAPILFLADAVSYLLSALSESFIRLPETRDAPDAATATPKRGYLADTAEGFRYVWSRSGMRTFLLVASGVNFLAMPVVILLPFYVTDVLAQDAAWYGFLLASLGAGSMLGYLAAGAVRVEPRFRPWIILAAFVAVGLSMAVLGFVRMPLVALLVLAAVGAFSGVINIFVVTLIQLATPTSIRGRVMSVVITISGAVAPLGMALGGFLGDATGKNIPLVYLGCGSLIGLLVLAAAARPDLRDFLARDSAD